MYNWSRNTDWNFIFNSIRNNISDDLLLMAVLSGSDHWLVSGVVRSRLIESNFNFFSINSGLNDILSVVHIAWNTYVLDSASVLVNRLSCNRVQIGYIVLFLLPINVDCFSLLYWLYVGLSYMLICRDSVV